MRDFRRFDSLAVILAAVLAWGGPALAAQPTVKPGKERWPIKTSVPAGANLDKGKLVTYEDLVTLADAEGVGRNDARYQAARIPLDTALHAQEGEMLTTTGWLHLVAAEPDGDYHIQLSATPDAQATCLIVEVPNPDPDFVATEALRPRFQAARDFIKGHLLQDKDPSPRGSLLAHPAFVEVTGQLFYDDAHVGEPPRGKKGCQAGTLWELHPVTNIRFAPKPAQ